MRCSSSSRARERLGVTGEFYATVQSPMRTARSSLNHLVDTGEEFGRDRQAEKPGRAQIEGHLEVSWLFDWKVAWLGAPQDFVHIDGKAAHKARVVGRIRHEAA